MRQHAYDRVPAHERDDEQGLKTLASTDSDKGAGHGSGGIDRTRRPHRATLASADGAAVKFPHFWHFGRPARPSDPDDRYASSQAWRDLGLADEVEAFLAGRLVNHLTASRQPMPAWAVLNRLAHADHSDLLRLVEGAADWIAHPSSGQAYWVAAERFVAAHLLARARTPDDLGRLQRAALVPLELVLIELTKIDPLTADEVLQLGAEAVDSYYPGR